MTLKRIVQLQLLCQLAILILPTTEASSSQNKLATEIAEISGVVSAENGRRLPGVIVRGPQTVDCRTDENGRFSMRVPSDPVFCCVVQFRQKGYRTVTKAIDPQIGTLDVVLKPGESLWIPRTWDPSDSKRIGITMRLAVPKGATIKRGHDVDYWTVSVGFGPKKNREWMQIGGGPTWSLGLPSKGDMASSIEIAERDMGCWDGIDIRGRSNDGRRWRFTGMWGETIRYNGVSEKAAMFFDSIIDGLCCDPEAVPGLGRLP